LQGKVRLAYTDDKVPRRERFAMGGRRLLLTAGALSLLGLAAVLTWLLVLRRVPGITHANYSQLQKGMTEAEVEAILGGVAKNYSGKRADELEEYMDMVTLAEHIERELRHVPAVTPHTPVVPRLWVGDEIAILVLFREGRVQSFHRQPVADPVAPW
jgi:hypothetical protein